MAVSTKLDFSFLQAAFNSIPDTLVIADSDRRIISVNSAFEKTFGYSQSEVIGNKTAMLYASDDFIKLGQTAFNPDAQILSDLHEVSYKRNDEEEFTGETLDSVVRGQSGEAVGYVSVIRDLDKRYRLISRKSADLVCLHGNDGTYEFVSPSVRNILGFEPKDLLGSNPYLLIHPNDRGMDLKAMAEQGQHKAEYRIQRKDGSFIWFETTTELIRDEDYKVIKFRTGSRDITERKKLELLLNDTSQLVSVGGWEFEIKSGQLIWTDEIYQIYELPLGTELDVEEAIHFIAPEYRPLVEDKFTAAIEHGEGYDIELVLITAKRNRKWVRAVGKALKDEKGETYKVYGVFQDLTERKKMEDRLVSQNEKLQNLVKATNKINSVIGHDLKSPLNIIIGFSDLLLKDIADDESKAAVRKKLDIIYNTSKNMTRLLGNLLEWSRMQTDDMKINLEEISIPEIVTDAIDLLNPAAQQKNILIKSDPSTALDVTADRQMIKTVIRNFLSNAIKFSREGDTVEVSYGREKNRWFISVRDEGEGMSDEILSKLFDPDNHPSKPGTNHEKGTGLGLRLCNQLVEKHNGTIEIESEAGSGSVFTVYVPVG